MTPRKVKQPEWVRLSGNGLLCIRCGGAEKLFPMQLSPKRIKAMQLIGEAFNEEHAGCAETAASPSRRVLSMPEEWLAHYDTGLISEVICFVMSGKHKTGRRVLEGGPSPRDPADFGRCYRLLKLFPDWLSRMSEVAAMFPKTAWPAFVREWDRLTALWETESPSGKCPRLYALMKELEGEARP